jgi:phage-related protein
VYQLKEILEGKRHDIFALVDNDRCVLEEFMKDLPRPEQVKVLALMERMADYGSPQNDQKFKHLEGPLYELKSYQVRIPCFFDGARVVILTHGFLKKRDRTPRTEIDRALRMAKEYFSERKRK